MLEKAKELFGSRRFYATIITAVLNIINDNLKLVDHQTMLTIDGLVISWIVAESLRSTSPGK